MYVKLDVHKMYESQGDEMVKWLTLNSLQLHVNLSLF